MGPAECYNTGVTKQFAESTILRENSEKIKKGKLVFDLSETSSEGYFMLGAVEEKTQPLVSIKTIWAIADNGLCKQGFKKYKGLGA
jgi:hypothetical protein